MPLSPGLIAVEDRVRANVKRGTAFDTQITAAVSDAVRWVERNYSLPYMKIESTWQIGVGSDVLALATGAERYLKRVMSVWHEVTNSSSTKVTKHFLSRIDPADLFDATPNKDIEFYFATGRDTFKVNTTAEEILNGKYIAYVHSRIPVAADSWSFRGEWLATEAADVLEAKAMLLLAPKIRNEAKILPVWNPAFQESLRTLLISEDELEQGDRYNEQMSYIPEL